MHNLTFNEYLNYRKVSASAKDLFLTLVYAKQQGALTDLTSTALANQKGVTKGAVNKWLVELETVGWIAISHRGCLGNSYTPVDVAFKIENCGVN